MREAAMHPDTGPVSWASRAEICAAAAFRAALRRFERDSEQIARAHDLTPQRYLLLLLIKGAPDGSERSTVGELSGRLQLAQHTVTELVGRAEAAGLIRRERSSRDRRVVHLLLTREGEERLARSFIDHQTERRTLLAALGGSSQQAARPTGLRWTAAHAGGAPR
jgi:DNA-binding MarR family transcriptional regulator